MNSPKLLLKYAINSYVNNNKNKQIPFKIIVINSICTLRFG